MTDMSRVKDEAALHIKVPSALFCMVTYSELEESKVLKIESINIVDK